MLSLFIVLIVIAFLLWLILMAYFNHAIINGITKFTNLFKEEENENE